MATYNRPRQLPLDDAETRRNLATFIDAHWPSERRRVEREAREPGPEWDDLSRALEDAQSIAG